MPNAELQLNNRRREFDRDLEIARCEGREANAVAQRGELKLAREMLNESKRLHASLTELHPYAAADAYLTLHQHGDVDSSYRILSRALNEEGVEDDSLTFNEILGMLIICAQLRGDSAWWRYAMAIAEDANTEIDPVNTFTIEVSCRTDAPDPSDRRRQRLAVERSMRSNAAWKTTTLLVATHNLHWQAEENLFLDAILQESRPATNGLGVYGMSFALSRRKVAMWTAAAQHANDLINMAQHEDLTYFEARLRGVLAVNEAYLGNADRSRKSVRIAEAWALPRGLRLILEDTWHARSIVALGSSNFEEAYAFLTQLSKDPVRWMTSDHGAAELVDLAEACDRLGRREDARDALNMAIARGVQEQSPRQGMAITAARAILEENPSKADELFRCALHQGGDVTSPFDSARIRLAHAHFLHTVRKDAVGARAQVRRAVPDFEALGASLWVSRAKAELQIYKRSGRSVDEGESAALSVQESQVVLLAARGLTNKEIAARLYISPRTVGFHLYNAFPKLGVTSRAGLRDALTHEAHDSVERDRAS